MKRTILYLGLNPPKIPNTHVLHYPMIQIIPREASHPDIILSFSQFSEYTHFIFTSQSSVDIFVRYLSFFKLQSIIAKEETAEGVIKELELLNPTDGYFFWPHSSLSRPAMKDYFKKKKWPLQDCILYDTKLIKYEQNPDLTQVDEIIFTSPSTVDGFLANFGQLPKEKKLTAIGPITQKKLDDSDEL
jgi:uroporphyrinogen-III synthase